MFFIFTGMIIIGAFIAAVDLLPQHNAVSEDLAVAISTARREGAHRAFKAVKMMSFPTQPDFKAFRVFVPTDLATSILRCILEVIHTHPQVLESQREAE